MSLAELRTATSVSHSRLEKNLNLFESVQTKPQYIKHLQKYYVWLSSAEENLHPFIEKWPLPHYFLNRRKLLLADLESLQAKLDENSFEKSTPQYKNASEALGAIYVLAGSTLGGQIIYQHYSKKLGLSSKAGLSFYYGQGSNTGKDWQAFLKILESHFDQHPESIGDVSRGASLTFDSIENALCED